MATISSMLIKIGVQLDGSLRVEEKLRGLKASAKDTTGALSKIGAGLKSLAAPAAAAAAALSAAAIGIFKFVESQTEAIAALNDTAKAVGIGVEEYQRLQFAADQSGVSQETLATGMTKFNAVLLELQRGGGKKARETLEQLGIAVSDLEGLSRTQQIGRIGDALKGVANESERSALAATLFGKSAGPQMAQLLDEGTAGLEALTAAAQGVLSEDDVARAAAFDDQLQAAKASVEGLMRGIAIELLPVVAEAVQAFSGWIERNDEFIRQGVGGVVEVLADQIAQASSAFTLLSNAVQTVDDVFAHLRPTVEQNQFTFSGLVSEVVRLITPLGALVGALADIQDGMEGAASRAMAFSSALADVAAMNAAIAKAQAPPPPGKIRELGPLRSMGGPERRAGGGGGGGAREPATTGPSGPSFLDKLAARVAHGPEPTVESAIQALIGQRGHPMTDTLRAMAARSPIDRNVQPRVHMDVHIANFENTFNITAPDATAAGREVSQAIRREFARTTAQAAQALIGNTVR